jgi:hypothetical protein
MNCGWPLYRQPYAGSFRYVCGYYTQSKGKRCSHNRVDGPLATQFARSCLRQKLDSPRLMGKVEAILARMSQKASPRRDGKQAKSLAKELEAARARLALVERNMSFATTKEAYQAVEKQYASCLKEFKELEVRQQALAQRDTHRERSDEQIQTALDFIRRLVGLSRQETSLDSLGQLIQETNLRLFFRFCETQKKKRVINAISGGRVTFGSAAPPVTLYRGVTGKKQLEAALAHEAEPKEY